MWVSNVTKKGPSASVRYPTNGAGFLHREIVESDPSPMSAMGQKRTSWHLGNLFRRSVRVGCAGAIGGYFFRLCSNSVTIFMAGPAFQLLRSAVAGYSSFGSVMRSKALGEPSFVGGLHQSRCSS